MQSLDWHQTAPQLREKRAAPSILRVRTALGTPQNWVAQFSSEDPEKVTAQSLSLETQFTATLRTARNRIPDNRADNKAARYGPATGFHSSGQMIFSLFLSTI